MAGVPEGKRVLNTHISSEEHHFLKWMARKHSMTVTMYLRNIIRREMGDSHSTAAAPQAPALPEFPLMGG